MQQKLKKLFTNVWTIPNVLTMLRLLLIPVFVVLFVNGQPKWALGAFALASFTDFWDGFLARKLNQITDFGKLFDPLADKLMVITALICQGAAGVLPWPAIVIVGLKELLMVIGGSFMLKKGIVVYSVMAGKVAQVCFIAALLASFFHEELAAWGCRLDLILLWVSVALALIALGVYATRSYRQLKQKTE